MPNLPTHFNFAIEIMSELKDPSLDSFVGSYLLGCTTPDIRARTKWDREYTHFAPLEVDQVGIGTKALFDAYPDLYDVARVSGETRAFLAGYISHLTADESWITRVYRPYFHGGLLFDSQMEANISDRAVQMDMDLNSKNELGGLEEVLLSMDHSDAGVQIGFIDHTTLKEWKEWVMDLGQRPFNWDRLYFMANRMYKDNEEARSLVENFLMSVPDSLEKVYQKVPREQINEFKKRAVTASVQLIKEHLYGS